MGLNSTQKVIVGVLFTVGLWSVWYAFSTETTGQIMVGPVNGRFYASRGREVDSGHFIATVIVAGFVSALVSCLMYMFMRPRMIPHDPSKQV